MIIQNDRLMDTLPYLPPTVIPPEKLAFLDLETSAYGRKNSRIQYLGLIFYQEDGWYTRQWLPETPEDERCMLQEVTSLLSSFSCLIHYNGNSFDLPILQKRCAAFQLPLDLSDLESLDLYRTFTPLKKLLGLPHLDERSLEQFLGLSRTKVSDNDLTMLPQLLLLFSYLELIQGGFTVLDASLKGTETNQPSLTIRAALHHPVPNEFSLHLENSYLSCQKTEFQMLFYGVRDTMKYFYQDYKNYYYLPEEDTAIHKSVAAYVDKDHRVPAKAANCYTKRLGCFLPQSKPHFQPAFQKNYKDNIWYLSCDEKFLQDSNQLRDFVVFTLTGA